MFHNRVKAVLLMLCLSMIMAPAAFASDDTNVTVSAGSLTITADPTASDFSGVTLNGSTQSPTANLSAFEVNDARGSGAGWNVTAQATQFKEYAEGAYVTDGKTLATSSLSIAAPTVAQDGTTSAVPTMTGGVVDGGSARKIASAALNQGMGKYDIAAAALTLTVPPSAYATTYRSDLTITLSTAP